MSNILFRFIVTSLFIIYLIFKFYFILSFFSPRKPLDDIQYLLDNAICFQEKHEFPKKKKKPSVCSMYSLLNEFLIL